LINEAQINPMGLDWRRFVVAVDERDQVVGCGQVKTHRGGACELASLAVSRGWRGRGVGGQIIQRLMRDAQPPLWLMCRSGLVPFYQEFGFKEVGVDEPQPAHFRRMRSLVSAFVFASRQDHLAIMVWWGE
jgi:N-acetylglutamate synthase-like GNAT family acetyltransferase